MALYDNSDPSQITTSRDTSAPLGSGLRPRRRAQMLARLSKELSEGGQIDLALDTLTTLATLNNGNGRELDRGAWALIASQLLTQVR